MNKENIIKLLNTIFKKDAIANAIADVTGQKLDNIEIEVNKIYNNLFLTTSDENGLKTFEDELEIVFTKNQGASDRKSIISAKWRGAGTLTLELIQQTVDAYTNEDIIVRFDTVIILDFTNDVGKPDNIEALKKQLEEIVPAHLGIEYIFRYRTWGELEPYKYINIENDTWKSVKEDANIGIKENKTKARNKRDILQSDSIYYPKKTDYVDIDVLNNNTKILDEKKLEKSDLVDVAKEVTSQKILENINNVDSVITESLTDVAKESTSKQILSGVVNIGGVVDNSLKDYSPKSYLAKLGESIIENKQLDGGSISAGSTKTICSITANSNQEILTPLIRTIEVIAHGSTTPELKPPIIHLKFDCEDGIKDFKIMCSTQFNSPNKFSIYWIWSEEIIKYLISEPSNAYNSSFDLKVAHKDHVYDTLYFKTSSIFKIASTNRVLEVSPDVFDGSNDVYGVFLPAMRKIKKFTIEVENNTQRAFEVNIKIQFMIRNI